LPDAEIAQLVRESYELVLAKLPRKARETATKVSSAQPRAKRKSPGNLRKKKRK